MIDRISPTRRPPRRPIGYQLWRALLFMHWPVAVEALRPLVPARLSLDVHEGTAYVGLTPFLVRRARWLPMPATLGLNFLETNVRTYVHLDGCEPGVYFFSLDAGSRIAVAGARLGFGLPYFHARMERRQRDRVVNYTAQRLSGLRPRLNLSYEPGEPLGESAPGTVEHFLLERYLLHVERAGALCTVQVHHAPYPAQRARVLDMHDELIGADGIPQPVGPPPLVHYAAGVDVEIFAPRIHRS